MKKVIFMGLILFESLSQGGLVTCPPHIKNNVKYKAVLSYLSAIQGHFRVGECQVELHVCSGEDSRPSDSIGDVLITSDSGRETYMQIFLPSEATPNVSASILVNKQLLHYEFENHIPDSVSGRLQSNKIEFYTDLNRRKIISITMGTYSSKEAATHINQYAYTWNECGPK